MRLRCPECDKLLSLAERPEEGSIVKCPGCHTRLKRAVKAPRGMGKKRGEGSGGMLISLAVGGVLVVGRVVGAVVLVWRMAEEKPSQSDGNFPVTADNPTPGVPLPFGA